MRRAAAGHDDPHGWARRGGGGEREVRVNGKCQLTAPRRQPQFVGAQQTVQTLYAIRFCSPSDRGSAMPNPITGIPPITFFSLTRSLVG